MKHRQPTLDRRQAVADIGAPCWDTAAADTSPLNFYLWGGMGGAGMIGLGLALAQPKRRVLVITGDGEMLMGLGSLATIGVQQPRNLAIIVMDNERYGETGMQLTHTRFDIDDKTSHHNPARFSQPSRSRHNPYRWRCRYVTAPPSRLAFAKRSWETRRSREHLFENGDDYW